MIKRYIKLLTGLIIVALIAVGAYIGVSVSKNNQHKKAIEEEAKKQIFSFQQADISAMVIHNSSGDYRLEDSSEGWIVTEGDSFPVSTDKIIAIADSMYKLTASRILTEELPEDLSGYGLEDPMRLCIMLRDGTECSVDIGTQIPGETDYYVRVTGKDTIYILDESTVSDLSVQVEDLKDKYLFDAPNTDSITALKYTENGSIVYDLRKDDSGWSLFTPFPQGKVNNAGVVDITSQIIRAQCITFIDEEMNDLSKFGFDNPKYQLEIKSENMEANIIFGNYYDENQQYIYAYNKNRDQIYIFEAATLGFIGTRPEEIVVRELHNEFFGNIDSFDVNVFGKEIKINYNYSASGEGETYYAVNDEKVDDTNDEILEVFNNMINSITGLSFDTICENVKTSELQAEPAATIVYHLKEGDDYKLEFIQKNDEENMYYIVENGKYTNTLLRKSALESGVLMYYNDLMNIIG